MKKILSAVLAGATVLSMASVGAMAYSKTDMYAVDPAMVVDEDGNPYASVTSKDGSLTIDGVIPNSVVYIPVYNGTDAYNEGDAYFAGDFRESKLYSFKSTKDENSKLVKSIDFVTEKNVGSFKDKPDWIKIVLNDSNMTSEKKFEGSVTFKAKKSSSENNNPDYTAPDISVNDSVTLKINLWINNQKVDGSDGSAETGDRVYFNPEKNETNTLIWGDDRAALKFEADDDAGKFYARLSTKSMSDIYTQFGDPVNADLWFYDFVGNPTIPATSRATLTLGFPWDGDDDYTPNPQDCYIYELSSEGILSDVTSQFTYSEDEEEIEGWSIKTRKLGTYIVSDTKLDLEVDSSDAPVESSSIAASSQAPSTNGGKEIPSTGSSDMVNVAVVAAVASLAVAGALAFRKTSK